MAYGQYKEWLTEDGLTRIESWARDGLSLDQIAGNININVSTFREWRKRFPEIQEAVKRGQRPVELAVENAVLKAALGYTYTETTRTQTEQQDGTYRETVTVVEKHAKPDIAAAQFWLRNRKPEQWRKLSLEFKAKTEAETEKIKLETEALKAELQPNAEDAVIGFTFDRSGDGDESQSSDTH